MKFVNRCKSISMLLLLVLLQACGGGSASDTNGSLVISVPATGNAGKSLQVSAVFFSPKGVQALPITFSSSDPTVVLGATSDTNASGVAVAQLTTRNIINGDRSVVITASNGGVTSRATVVIRSNKLTFNTPAAGAVTATAGSSIEYFISGAGSLIKYTDPDGLPISGQAVSIKVNTIVGLTDVVFHWNLTNTSYLTQNPFVLTTLSDGSLPNAVVSLFATAPGTAAAVNSYNANFILSVTDPNFGIMSVPGDIPFKITAQ